MEILDLTGENGALYAWHEEDNENLDLPAPVITLNMLNSRPDIKSVLLDTLDEFLVKWTDVHAVTGSDCPKEVETFTDEQILNAVNSDPYVQGTVYECLNDLSDTVSAEGVSNYYPSVFDSDNVQTLAAFMAAGLRENQTIEDLPAKYAHLDAETIDLIYSHPQCRKILAKATGITAEMVRALCGPGLKAK